MSTGQISMCPNAAVDAVRLFWVNQGAVKQFIQNKANVWAAADPPPNPDQANFAKVKAIGGYGDNAVVLLGLDDQGALWWAASDTNNVWGTPWTRIPAPRPYQYFDAVSNVNAGIFLIGSRNGVADTQAFDGTNWQANSDWSSTPPANSQFTYPNTPGQPIPFLVKFPPPFADVAVDNNVAIREEDSAPVPCGLTSGPGAAPDFSDPNPTGIMGGGEPFSLYVDPDSNDWAWSTMPAAQITDEDDEGETETAQAPPYPTAGNAYEQYSGAFTGIWLNVPLMFMLGTDGNIYVDDAADGGVANWTYGGKLPNPLGLVYTKALWTIGGPRAADGVPATVRVILLGKETANAPAYPYLVSMPYELLHQGPANWAWQWIGQMPSQNPAVAVLDFDIQQGYPDVQVGLLGADGDIYINYQDVNGNWAFYGGYGGKGLP